MDLLSLSYPENQQRAAGIVPAERAHLTGAGETEANMTLENTEQGRGLRYQSDVPKEGWECVRIENLDGRSEICQWCDIRRMRHAFVMRHISWPDEVRAGSKCAADIGNPYTAQGVYEPDDEQLDESVRSQTDSYPQQSLAEQAVSDDVAGSGQRRWSFSENLLIAGVIAIAVILVLLRYH
jgi:hypothetical protein